MRGPLHDDKTLRLLERAAARFARYDQAAELHLRRQPGSTGAACRRVSRQADHQRLTRGQNLATAGCMILAAEQQRYRDFVTSAAFGFLHPYSATVYSKLECLLDAGHRGTAAGWLELWQRLVDELFSASRPRKPSALEQGMRLHGVTSGLFGVVLCLGNGAAEPWAALWRRAGRRHLLDKPHWRMLLALVGVYSGRHHAYLEWLCSSPSRRYDLCDLLCFVRRDSSMELFEVIAATGRGGELEPRSCLYSSNPASTLNHLIRYCRTMLRRACNAGNSGLLMGALAWADGIRELCQGLLAAGTIDPDARELLDASLCKLGRTQLVERGRALRVIERIPDLAHRQQAELWWKNDPSL